MYMFELLLFIVIYTILQSVKQNNLVIIVLADPYS